MADVSPDGHATSMASLFGRVNRSIFCTHDVRFLRNISNLGYRWAMR